MYITSPILSQLGSEKLEHHSLCAADFGLSDIQRKGFRGMLHHRSLNTFRCSILIILSHLNQTNTPSPQLRRLTARLLTVTAFRHPWRRKISSGRNHYGTTRAKIGTPPTIEYEEYPRPPPPLNRFRLAASYIVDPPLAVVARPCILSLSCT